MTDSEFLELADITELDTSNAQCPLCSSTTSLVLTRLTRVRVDGEEAKQCRYRFRCEKCDSTIFFTRPDDVKAVMACAYSQPERGKEHEDYSRGP